MKRCGKLKVGDCLFRTRLRLNISEFSKRAGVNGGVCNKLTSLQSDDASVETQDRGRTSGVDRKMPGDGVASPLSFGVCSLGVAAIVIGCIRLLGVYGGVTNGTDKVNGSGRADDRPGVCSEAECRGGGGTVAQEVESQSCFLARSH